MIRNSVLSTAIDNYSQRSLELTEKSCPQKNVFITSLCCVQDLDNLFTGNCMLEAKRLEQKSSATATTDQPIKSSSEQLRSLTIHL